jgi:16S rRNA processing protein RimM
MSGDAPVAPAVGSSAAAQAPSAATDARFLTDDVRLGQINGVHGVSGEVKVFLYNPGSFLMDAAREVILVGEDGRRLSRRLKLRKGSGKRIIGTLPDSADPESAAKWMGFELVVPQAALPKPAADTWYVRDLVGLPVVTDTDRHIGRISEIHNTTGIDVWVIRQGTTERWVLALRENLVQVQLGERVVVVDSAVQEL